MNMYIYIYICWGGINVLHRIVFIPPSGGTNGFHPCVRPCSFSENNPKPIKDIATKLATYKLLSKKPRCVFLY